jgi:hypothetical protein
LEFLCRHAAVRGGHVDRSALAGDRKQAVRCEAEGDRRLGRIEILAGLNLEFVEETPNITLNELKAALAEKECRSVAARCGRVS